MNIKYLILCIVLILSSNMYAQNCKKKYRVVKIDSTKNNYLIYTKRKGRNFLIISLKDTLKTKQKIKLNKRYRLRLDDYEDYKIVGMPPNIDQTFSIDGKVVWKKGDEFDLHYTPNLIGLFYKKEDN